MSNFRYEVQKNANYSDLLYSITHSKARRQCEWKLCEPARGKISS